jgi:hypothetical protein
MMSEESREPVSEDTVHKLRKYFGPNLADEIEKWTLEVPYPESTLQMLTKSSVAEHVGYMIDVFAPTELSDEERENAIKRITVAANEAIVSRIRLL